MSNEKLNPGDVLPENAKIVSVPTAQNIHEAMERIWNEVGYVQKKGKVEGAGMKYTFAKETDFIAAIRPAMLENHVICYQIESSMAERSANVVEGKYGEKMNITSVVRVKIRFYHVPSNTYIDVEAMGEGQDAGDKATPKAETIAQKYALRKTFLIETGDDPDEVRPESDIKSYKKKTPQIPEKADPELNKKFASVVEGFTSKGIYTIDEIEKFLTSKGVLPKGENYMLCKEATKKRVVEDPSSLEKALIENRK